MNDRIDGGRKRPLPTQADVKALLDYDPATGIFRWRERDSSMFGGRKYNAERICLAWNTRYAGKVAGWPRRDGYLRISIFGEFYFAHRLAWLIMTGEWPANQIDHINLDTSDNRFANLRQADHSQNAANTLIQSNNTSGVRGVSWSKARGKWQAKVCVRGVELWLGFFTEISDAAAAYEAAYKKHFGTFARARR